MLRALAAQPERTGTWYSLTHSAAPATVRGQHAIEREATMGDKSPKSKQRDQKKRDAAITKEAAAAKSKQDTQGQYQRPAAKDKR